MNLEKSEILEENVTGETVLKRWLVDYTGEKLNKDESEGITVEDIVETMSSEFPEFLIAIAEENWIRGYHQALNDVDEGQSLLKAEENGEKN